MILILFLLFTCVRALPISQIDVQMGVHILRVLYDATKPFPSKVLHVMTENSILYAVGVDSGISDSVLCRRVITKQIITNPRGCDALNPTDAIVDYFCEFGGSLALQSARARTLAQWSLRADSPQCTDKSTCFGPVYVTSESWTPESVITDLDLIKSRGGVFVVSNAGPAGEIPMITYVPIRMPKLNLYSSCVGYEEMEFEMNAKDNYEGAYTNSTYVYGSGIVRRLRFERSGFGKFRIVLGRKGIGSEFYNDEYISILEYESVDSAVNTRVQFRTYTNETTLAPTLAPSLAPSNIPSQSPTSAPTSAPDTVPTSSPTFLCSSELILSPAPRPFELIEPVPKDDLTYYLDRSGTYLTSECALRRGLLDEVNNLVYPDCPVNALCGGRTRFRAPGPLGPKFRVEPDIKYKDFQWDCVKFYARSNEFLTIAGSPVNRDAPELLGCNYPFPFPAQIEAKDNDVFEKLRQCKMVGGKTALESK